MEIASVTFTLTENILKGLSDQVLIRVGGLIRENSSQRIFALVRELKDAQKLVGKMVDLFDGGYGVDVLNLGISTMSLLLILKKIKELDQKMMDSQDLLRKIDKKIDVSFLSDLQASINMLDESRLLKNPNNSKDSIIHALSILEISTIRYLTLAKMDLETDALLADVYIPMLSLAYAASARCYLDLGENQAALSKIEQGKSQLGELSKQHVKLLLTANPAMYLHPALNGKISLRKLTKVYQWMGLASDESCVFDILRDKIYESYENPEKWLNELPSTMKAKPKIKEKNPGQLTDFKKLILEKQPSYIKKIPKYVFEQLPISFNRICNVVEENQRFNSYSDEIRVIRELGISFEDWQKLSSGEMGEDNDFCFIVLG